MNRESGWSSFDTILVFCMQDAPTEVAEGTAMNYNSRLAPDTWQTHDLRQMVSASAFILEICCT